MSKGKLNWGKLEKENRKIKQGQIVYQDILKIQPPDLLPDDTQGYLPDKLEICPYCRDKFLSILLPKHIQEKHKNQIEKNKNSTAQTRKLKSINVIATKMNEVFCPFCNALFSQNDIQSHLESAHKVEAKEIVIKDFIVKCGICGEFVRIQDQINHFKKMHRKKV